MPANHNQGSLLNGFTTPTPLPAGVRGAPSRRGSRRVETLVCSADATSAVQRFLEREGLELVDAAAAAWGILLRCFGAQDDVAFGVIDDSWEASVRLQIDPGQPLNSWLREVANRVSEARRPAAGLLPNGNGQSASQPIGETAVACGSTLEEPQLPLLVEVSTSPAPALILTAHYDGARFLEGAVSNVLQSLATILESLASGTGAISELRLLSSRQVAQQLTEWCDKQVEYDRNKCIHEVFEEQVRRSPAATAITVRDRTLSYQELDRRANRLAHYLRKRGAGPDSIVAIYMDRSPEMVVGLLGILKAGAAYLPLDADYPPQRLQFMIQDSGSVLIVTQDRYLERFPGLQIVSIDGDWDRIAAESDEPPDRAADGHNLAYVIYTSGSTGKPKGVMVEHGQVANFFAAMDRVIGIELGVWLAVTSISFDISAFELFWTLGRGFHVVLLSEADKLTAEGQFSAGALMERHAVSHLQCTPSMANFLSSVPTFRQALRRVRKLMIGGEAFPPALAGQLMSLTPGEVYNMYGPTETTIWSATHRVQQNEQNIAIGRPIANTQIYILDCAGKLLPTGAIGELCIGGDGLARGYLNQQELTADKFETLTIREPRKERVYRTGDLARYRPNGEIEFMGRVDNQVKIHGHRVELEEIEALLGEHPEVRGAAVGPRDNANGVMPLVAYVVQHKQHASGPKELRFFLEERLPSYLIPAEFVFLDALPYTPNGKIDRKALATMREPLGNLRNDLSGARSLEDVISDTWKDALGLDTIAGSENLFDLGANSMLILQIASRLRELCGRDIAVTDLFKYPTISSLAAYLGNGSGREHQIKNSSARGRSRKEAMTRKVSRVRPGETA